MAGTLRVDAVRNRARVLAAAREVHSEDGRQLAVQDVARRAGVGVGTIYRHFGTREGLLDAVALSFFEEALALARAVEREREPGDRLAAFVHGFFGALAEHGVPGHCSWDAPASAPVRAELRDLLARFVSDGQHAGAVRPDLTTEDAAVAIWTVVMLVDATRAPEIWQRHLALVLDGFRADGRGPLDAAPFSRAAWDAARTTIR